MLLTVRVTVLQIRTIRRKMVEIMTREAVSCDLKELVGKFIPEAIGKEIEKATQGTYPLQVRRARMQSSTVLYVCQGSVNIAQLAGL